MPADLAYSVSSYEAVASACHEPELRVVEQDGVVGREESQSGDLDVPLHLLAAVSAHGLEGSEVDGQSCCDLLSALGLVPLPPALVLLLLPLALHQLLARHLDVGAAALQLSALLLLAPLSTPPLALLTLLLLSVADADALAQHAHCRTGAAPAALCRCCAFPSSSPSSSSSSSAGSLMLRT